MIDVKGKWCLITGGCRGVGRLIAIEMAKLGANLILQGRDKSHAEKVIAELAPYGVQVKAVGCNLENESEIDAALAEIDSFGVQVDLVFNNAGLMSHYFTDYTTNTMDDFRQAMAVNFFAPIKIAYHFLPGMIKRDDGESPCEAASAVVWRRVRDKAGVFMRLRGQARTEGHRVHPPSCLCTNQP